MIQLRKQLIHYTEIRKTSNISGALIPWDSRRCTITLGAAEQTPSEMNSFIVVCRLQLKLKAVDDLVEHKLRGRRIVPKRMKNLEYNVI